MATTTKATFQLRRGKAKAWKKNNPVLMDGEPAFESDTGKLKIGNSSDAYNNLPYLDSGADPSLGLAGASKGQSPVVKTVDGDGKPMEWEAAALAKADGSNIPNDVNVQNLWTTKIAALPGIKVYGKADANGKIMAYIDAACTLKAGANMVMGINDYSNALLIYDHKTYQCVGFEQSASAQVSDPYLVVVFSRTDVRKDKAGTTDFTAETARMDILGYLSGTVDAPITIETYTITDMNVDM